MSPLALPGVSSQASSSLVLPLLLEDEHPGGLELAILTEVFLPQGASPHGLSCLQILSQRNGPQKLCDPVNQRHLHAWKEQKALGPWSRWTHCHMAAVT